MDKYWVIGTSIDNYIKSFLKLINKVAIGEVFIADYTDENRPQIIYENESIISYKTSIVMRQTIDVWLGLGIIRESMLGFKVLFDIPDINKIIKFSKMFLFDKSDSKNVNRFRFTKQIDILVINNILNNYDLSNSDIKQTRGILTTEKIMALISNYEKNIAEDKEIVEMSRRTNVK